MHSPSFQIVHQSVSQHKVKLFIATGFVLAHYFGIIIFTAVLEKVLLVCVSLSLTALESFPNKTCLSLKRFEITVAMNSGDVIFGVSFFVFGG